MSMLGEAPEGWHGRLLRYIGYFLFGAIVGLLPAIFALAVSPSRHIAWKTPVLIVVGFGAVFCAIGILTGGRFLVWLLGFFGRHIDPP